MLKQGNGVDKQTCLGVKRWCWQLQCLGSRTENSNRSERWAYRVLGGPIRKAGRVSWHSPLVGLCVLGGECVHTLLAKPNPSTCFWHSLSQVGISTSGYRALAGSPSEIPLGLTCHTELTTLGHQGQDTPLWNLSYQESVTPWDGTHNTASPCSWCQYSQKQHHLHMTHGA